MMNISATQDELLASSSEIMMLLARMATPASRYSAITRNQQEMARNALKGMLDISVPSALARATERLLTPTPTGAAVDDRTDSAQPIGRRTHCKCGGCTLCLDNTRRDRILNEKFADSDSLRLSSWPASVPACGSAAVKGGTR